MTMIIIIKTNKQKEDRIFLSTKEKRNGEEEFSAVLSPRLWFFTGSSVGISKKLKRDAPAVPWKIHSDMKVANSLSSFGATASENSSENSQAITRRWDKDRDEEKTENKGQWKEERKEMREKKEQERGKKGEKRQEIIFHSQISIFSSRRSRHECDPSNVHRER